MIIQTLYSANFSKKLRKNSDIKLIVIHYTGMQSKIESVKRLLNPKHKVSTHYLIDRKGRILKMVDDNKIAWHAGKSKWKNYINLNKYSIGIELVNKGHEFGYEKFTISQVNKLIKLCKNLKNKYKIKNSNIVGHSDIAPLRKLDPGEKFPWEKMAKNKIGIWHNLKERHLIKFRKIKIINKSRLEFIKKLKKIGYCLNHRKKGSLKKITKAFQRHYRKELIDGIIDKECLIIAKNISKKV